MGKGGGVVVGDWKGRKGVNGIGVRVVGDMEGAKGLMG